MKDRDDVVVIGAGPAGLLVAAYLGRSGYRVSVVERAPQPAAGVLVLTAPGQEAFQDVGWIELLRALPGARPVTRLIIESDRERLLLDEQWNALVLPRDAAVTLLCGEAERLGVHLLSRHTAVVPLLDGQRVAGVRVRDQRGCELELRARLVVDASGPQSFFAATFGLLLPRRGPRRLRLEQPMVSSVAGDQVLGLVNRNWLHLIPSQTGWLSAVLRERERDGTVSFPDPASLLARLSSGSSCELGGESEQLPCSALPRVVAGEGWLAVGEAAGSGCPGLPGAASRGLSIAASAASEIDLALRQRRAPNDSQLGATITLIRRAIHPESLLDRALARAADMGLLSAATAGPWRRRILSSMLRGHWEVPRLRLGRILYLWWLDLASRRAMRRKSRILGYNGR